MAECPAARDFFALGHSAGFQTDLEPVFTTVERRMAEKVTPGGRFDIFKQGFSLFYRNSHTLSMQGGISWQFKPKIRLKSLKNPPGHFRNDQGDLLLYAIRNANARLQGVKIGFIVILTGIRGQPSVQAAF